MILGVTPIEVFAWVFLGGVAVVALFILSAVVAGIIDSIRGKH